MNSPRHETQWRDITKSRATASKTKKVFLVLMHKDATSWAWVRTQYEVHFMPKLKVWRTSERKKLLRGHTMYHYDQQIADFETQEEACGFLEATYRLMTPAQRVNLLSATATLNN